ncbi:MAG: BlaI/MecI/CopY family transcriptional regulator [Bacteroidota bacterium]
MKGNKEIHPSAAETEVLQILWEKEPQTVREIHEALSKKRPVGYTTTLKKMQRMFEKGLLKRVEGGKSHLYSAVAQPSETRQKLFDRLVDTAFEGSAMKLVMHALGGADTSPEEIEQLIQWLETQKTKNNRHE